MRKGKRRAVYMECWLNNGRFHLGGEYSSMRAIGPVNYGMTAYELAGGYQAQ